MSYKLTRITRAIWAYLNQSITPNSSKNSIWKFKRFYYQYQINLLESCWLQESFNSNHKSSGQDGYRTGN